jgi:hypothetical protein
MDVDVAEREHLAVTDLLARLAGSFTDTHSTERVRFAVLAAHLSSVQGGTRPAERLSGIHPVRDAVGRDVPDPLVDEPAQVFGHVRVEVIGAFGPGAGLRQIAAPSA